MSSQTALAVTAVGSPLEKISLPIPTPTAGQALLKVTVAGLCPVDHKMLDIGVMDVGSHLPAVLGHDIVGTVVSNGPGASLAIGTHVFSQSEIFNFSSGSLQEYTTVLARFATEVPSNVTDVEASTFPINSYTSGISLFGPSGFQIPLPETPESKEYDYAAQTLVIIGGGTNCGKFAIQFARIAKIGTIIVTASLSGADELKKLGATHVIDRRASDVKEQIRHIVGDGCLYVYDTYNYDLSLAVSVLSNSKRGTLVRLIPVGETIEPAVEAEKENGWEDKVTFGAPNKYPEFSELFLPTFKAWVENGLVLPSASKTSYGLDAEVVNKVLDDMRNGKTEKPAIKI